MSRAAAFFALLLWPALAFATTRYVDGSCANNGDGTLSSCAGSPGGAGAYNSVSNSTAASCGDTVNYKAGTYSFNNVTFSSDCSAGPSPLILQANGWTAVGAGTQDAVDFVNVGKSGNAHLTSGDWTQCTTCDGADNAACLSVPATCTDAWWHTKSGDGSNRVYWGVKPDGSITPRRTALTGLSAQYDAYGSDGGSTLTVKWGSALPTNPDVNSGNNNNILTLSGKYITVRGIRFSKNINAAINVLGDHITVQDNTFKYFNDGGNGSARALYSDSATNMTIADNEFAYSSSEPLHISTFTSGTTSGSITRNYVHDIGDLTALGAGTSGTPNCTTFTNDASDSQPTGTCPGSSGVRACNTGDNTGMTVEDNLFVNCSKHSTAEGEYGIYLESAVDNMVVRNNIVVGASTMATLRPHHSTPSSGTNHTSHNTFYNNLFYGTYGGGNAGDGSCIALETDGNASTTDQIQDNAFWNNTCMDIPSGIMCIDTGAGTALNFGTTNTIANTICVSLNQGSPSNFLANNSQGGITLKNDVSWSGQGSGQCATVNSAAFNCGTNGVVCGDPVVVNAGAHDYHIQTSSPAKDAGTATGLPAGRTKDINNTIASLHGFASYADNQSVSGTIDIGMDEYVAASSARRIMIISRRKPSPMGEMEACY